MSDTAVAVSRSALHNWLRAADVENGTRPGMTRRSPTSWAMPRGHRGQREYMFHRFWLGAA
ncbi:MAG: hypothetical protein ACRYG2_29055 [Janthinobacterium lividum]